MLVLLLLGLAWATKEQCGLSQLEENMARYKKQGVGDRYLLTLKLLKKTLPGEEFEESEESSCEDAPEAECLQLAVAGTCNGTNTELERKTLAKNNDSWFHGRYGFHLRGAEEVSPTQIEGMMVGFYSYFYSSSSSYYSVYYCSYSYYSYYFYK